MSEESPAESGVVEVEEAKQSQPEGDKTSTQEEAEDTVSAPKTPEDAAKGEDLPVELSVPEDTVAEEDSAPVDNQSKEVATPTEENTRPVLDREDRLSHTDDTTEEKDEGKLKKGVPSIPSIIIQEEDGQVIIPEEEEDDEEEAIHVQDKSTDEETKEEPDAEKEEQEDEGEEEEEEEEEEFNRDEAIEHYKKLIGNMEKLQQSHHQLQHKIAEYLARKIESKHDPERDVTDQEQRYQKCLETIDELQQELADRQSELEIEEKQMKTVCEHKQAHVAEARKEFVDLIQGQAALATSSRTGRKLNPHSITESLGILDRKDAEVTQVRLENIKLQNRIQKLDTLIKQKEQLAEGLHMIDFEQLRINNADLNDKIEERNEEIMKLKKKITSTIQVLAHLKEKLQFLQAENANKKAILKEVDEDVAKKRDLLTKVKQTKDIIRLENTGLKQQGGLTSYHTLLRDFENKLDQSEEMKSELQKLQHRHSNLILQCNTLRQRIDQTRILQT